MAFRGKHLAYVYLLCLTLLAPGCAWLHFNPMIPGDLPPILSQAELTRPYVKVGRIQITRDVYGIVDTLVTPEIREWGYNAIRAEAAKMGADAVILPDVTGRNITYLVMPSTEYRATGIAIKFK